MTFEKVAQIIADYKDIDAASIKPESTFAELGRGLPGYRGAHHVL